MKDDKPAVINEAARTKKRPIFDMYFFKSRLNVLLAVLLVLFFAFAIVSYFIFGRGAL